MTVSVARAIRSTVASESTGRGRSELLGFAPMGMQNRATVEHYIPALLEKSLDDSHREFFNQRAANWIAETQWVSSISSLTRHSEFAAIVAMGPPILKIVLNRMQHGDVRVHWFPVLKDVAREDPVSPHNRGVLSAMASDWIAWGKARRIIG